MTAGEVLVALAAIGLGIAFAVKPKAFARMHKYRAPSERSVAFNSVVFFVVGLLLVAIGLVAFVTKGL